MTERATRVVRAVSNTSPDGRLAPSEDLFDATRRRSASPVPSFRSTTTSVEAKGEIVEFGNFTRRQTFKIPRKPTLWAWIKGFWDREKFMRDLEETIIPEPLPKMSGSQFMFNVLVSTNSDNTKYHETRCLLDTGCLSGNLVTRAVVERLGYLESDFEQPTPLESKGCHTFTGQHFDIEAVVLLSWHHGASPLIYRKMRFLVVSGSDFEMIIGADAIARHSLLISPVLAEGEKRVIDESAEDPMVLDPADKHANWLSKVENDEHFLKKELKKPENQRVAAEIKRVEARLPHEKYMVKVLDHRLQAAKYRKKGDFQNARTQEELAKAEVDAWNEKNLSERFDGNSASTTTRPSSKTVAHAPIKRGSSHSK